MNGCVLRSGSDWFKRTTSDCLTGPTDEDDDDDDEEEHEDVDSVLKDHTSLCVLEVHERKTKLFFFSVELTCYLWRQMADTGFLFLDNLSKYFSCLCLPMIAL